MKKLFDLIVELMPQYKQANEEIKKLAIEINNAHFENRALKNDRKRLLTALRKIRTHINKLDKKDENVKAIKQLIKEVL